MAPLQKKYSITGYKEFLDPDGYPAIAPPWGTLNAIDLNTGEYLWRKPLGEYPKSPPPDRRQPDTRTMEGLSPPLAESS